MMWLTSLRRLITSKSRTHQIRRTPPQRRRFIPRLDCLEDRIVPTIINVGASDTAGLIAAINQANTDSANGIADTIDLTSSTYTISGVDNTTNGANALPVITATNLTINGNGATINGSYLGRLFNLGSGSGLTLEDLTLMGGSAVGPNAQGGAIYDAGNNLSMKTVTVEFNSAYATGNTTNGAGNNAQGGGLYISGGIVDLSSCNFTNNTALATSAVGAAGMSGGNAQGGGIYAGGATLTISGGSVNNDTIKAGMGGAGTSAHPTGGAGGTAAGGGVYATNTTVLIENGAEINKDTLYGGYGGTGGAGGTKQAGGQGGAGGAVLGGGLFVDGGSVSITGATTEISGDGGWGGDGGAGGNGGAASAGATGGSGGEAEGGGLYVVNAPVTVTGGTTIVPFAARGVLSPLLSNNSALAGKGGNGGANTAGPGGTGGAGGSAQGGDVFISGTGQNVAFGDASHSVSIQASLVEGGKGGFGGVGQNSSLAGAGGAGGLATGGGLTVYGDTLTLNNTTIADNLLEAGSGGSGASSQGIHGSGGDAQGAGLFVSGSSGVTVLSSLFAENSATGGSGGIALSSTQQYGQGGSAEGGGLCASTSTVTVLNSTFDLNKLSGGVAGTSNLERGGATQGGGLYNSNGSLTLVNDTVAWNELIVAPYQGVPAGQGGGVYNTANGTLNLTNTIIALDQIYTNTGSPTPTISYDDFDGAAAVNDSNLIGDSSSDPNYAVGGSQQLFVGSLSYPLPSEYSGQLPANYGGLTLTLPLNWSTSPAISHGDPSAATAIAQAEYGSSASANTATDARGLPRVIDSTIDIGATETQISLDSTPSVNSVQAGGTITYTLTVTNTESTTANVTLTDTLDANTTYQSSSGASWSITSTPSGSGGTVTAAASVASGSSATLTITVTVNSSVSADTTLSNTATIVPTGNTVAGGRSATATAQVSGVSTTNITDEVGLLRTPPLRDPFAGANAYIQGALFVNESGTTLTGPIALVLVGLPSDVTLTNASGTYDGSPYINIVPANGSWQAGWWHFLIAALEFSTSNPADIHYTPEIVQGI
ncbi:MAG TPA: choice-of-anchor Q domain-containing protein [Gemmataceae bacterium]|nr:choice-of-anchor Q domain-containing protein [Gemmataceae bacterium]